MTCYDCHQPLPDQPPARMRIMVPFASGNLREEWVPLCVLCARRRRFTGMELEAPR